MTRNPDGRVLVQGEDDDAEYPLLNAIDPDGRFEWGFVGKGPSELAISILAEHLGECPSGDILDRFMREIVALWPSREPWKIATGEIDDWLDKSSARGQLRAWQQLIQAHISKAIPEHADVRLPRWTSVFGSGPDTLWPPPTACPSSHSMDHSRIYLCASET